jgi:hypothetical protein
LAAAFFMPKGSIPSNRFAEKPLWKSPIVVRALREEAGFRAAAPAKPGDQSVSFRIPGSFAALRKDIFEDLHSSIINR